MKRKIRARIVTLRGGQKRLEVWLPWSMAKEIRYLNCLIEAPPPGEPLKVPR